ncbi:sugar phosphate nucleotidyltransferase [Niallia taxi]|uniref:sugar phosphate nucleotidyltransferase n=1 Tax=Niallia taxi TaxID=2499688 RepID=UPI002E21F8CB|nr:sugar phosphate nucleotidyltransferase [Niallia taxi]MED4039111.1 sugar phosphate nucleotidyltransferase [Niallia taxi]
MKFVLLSGGSGKRLWPLSNDSRSKQFLKVLHNSNGTKESMVQRVWGQLRKNNLIKDSLIATSKSQVEMIYNQLGAETPIVMEPERRDTFAAIALSAVYLYTEKNCDLNEVITVLPVDPFVEDTFFNRVKNLENALIQSNADLALMGVAPTFPSEKYGYIVPVENSYSSEYCRVQKFTEKPDKVTATKLIEKNALWNCGIFAFKLRYIIELLEELSITTNYWELLRVYNSLPQNSFDYEVVEKAKHIVAVPYEGYWKDLGTWNTLTEEMGSTILGKGIMGEAIINSHIINELDIPITLLGVNNVVVAASPDGILVTNKDDSPKVKEYVGSLGGRPMYEERRWGSYKVLDHTKFKEGNEVLTKRIKITANKNLSYQLHYKRSEVWTVVKGEGIFILNGALRHVRAGDVIQIPLATKHGIKAITDMEIIEVQSGSELIEEDIYRIEIDWDIIVNNEVRV